MIFAGLEHLDYYRYLFKISWPALGGLFVIYSLLGIRFIQAVKKNVSGKRTILQDKLLILLRLFFTLIVLSIYTTMFVQSYGDWFYRPSVSRGVVQSIVKKQSATQEDYLLTLRSGEESITVSIGKGLHNHLLKDDLIEIAYLPRKKEVFRCTILTRQAENVI
jgi:hypothetical protein